MRLTLTGVGTVKCTTESLYDSRSFSIPYTIMLTWAVCMCAYIVSCNCLCVALLNVPQQESSLLLQLTQPNTHIHTISRPTLCMA